MEQHSVYHVTRAASRFAWPPIARRAKLCERLEGCHAQVSGAALRRDNRNMVDRCIECPVASMQHHQEMLTPAILCESRAASGLQKFAKLPALRFSYAPFDFPNLLGIADCEPHPLAFANFHLVCGFPKSSQSARWWGFQYESRPSRPNAAA